MKEIIASPDEAGWYWFKKNKSDIAKMALVNEDGRAFSFDLCGNSREIDDLTGMWECCEPERL